LNSSLEFSAINRGKPEMVAHLLKYDSVHGKAPFEVTVEGDSIVVDGKAIKVLYESEPENLPWKEMGVDLVLECSGLFTDREGASKHLKAGSEKVLISAPAKNPDITVVLGVNDGDYDKDKHNIVSNASCTTNCAATVTKVLHDAFGISNGFISTIHAYTTSQNILDKSHKDFRRARAAGLSIIPTSSGVTKAIGEVIPSLSGKLDGMAFRVPVPDVSLIDYVLSLEKTVTIGELNRSLKKASEEHLKGIIDYCSEPLVSVDFIHSPYSAIVDSLETRVNGKLAKVLAWYDNEWGYCSRLVEMAEKMF
jgi:glyceraldehyde 3-phosphate dehydrogenase